MHRFTVYCVTTSSPPDRSSGAHSPANNTGGDLKTYAGVSLIDTGIMVITPRMFATYRTGIVTNMFYGDLQYMGK